MTGATTTERLVAEFSADTKAGERSFNALLGLIDRVEKMLTDFDGVDKYSKKFQDGSKKVEQTYRATEGKTKDHVGRLNRILGGITAPFSKLKGALMTGGSFLPGLAQISQIIQGIPQVGQLAHALVSPLTEATEAGIRFNAFLETSRMGFEGMFAGQANASEKAQEYINKLQKFAAKTPFQFEDLISDAQLMKAFGFELDEVIPKIESWGNAISASGSLSQEALEGVVRAMGQMRTKGKVSAEEMNQLLERNIPAWELLSKAIGKTVAQTQKLAERGRLRGKEAVDAMTAMINADPRYAGMMDRLSTSLTGRLSNLQDTRQQALGYATRNMTQSLSNSLGAALENSNLALEMGKSLDTQLKPVGALVEASSKIILGGGIIEGLVSGLSAGKAIIDPALKSLAMDTLVGGLMNQLGINSPAKTMIPLGESIAEGIAVGIEQGVAKFLPDMERSVDRLVDQLHQHAGGRRRLGGQESAEANMRRLFEREPNFLPKLKREAARRGINPDHLLNLMAVETAGTFRPDIKNPHSSATGLIQFMRETMDGKKRGRKFYPGLMTGSGFRHSDLRGMSATEQLDWVFRYFDQPQFRGKLGTQGALYAAVGGGRASRSDNAILFDRGDGDAYRLNAPAWDRNRDGVIRQGELGAAATARLGAGIRFTVNDPGYVTLVNKGGDLTGGTGQFIEKAVEKAAEAIKPPAAPAASPADVVELPHAAKFDATPYLQPLKTIGPTIEEGFKQGEAAAGSFYDKVVMSNAAWVEDMRGAFISSFEGMFAHIDEGWRAMLGSFVVSFLQALQQMATAALAAQIGKVLFGAGGEGGGGGWVGKLVGWVTGALFGGAGGGGGGAGASGGGASVGGMSFGPPPIKFAGGGFVRGPGTSWSDSILARLSNREGVINARAVAHYGGEGWVHAVNSLSLPRFASGGFLDATSIARPSRRDYQRPISEGRERYGQAAEQHWHVTQNFPVTSNIAQLAPQPMRRQGQQAYAGIRKAVRRGGPVMED